MDEANGSQGLKVAVAALVVLMIILAFGRFLSYYRFFTIKRGHSSGLPALRPTPLGRRVTVIEHRSLSELTLFAFLFDPSFQGFGAQIFPSPNSLGKILVDTNSIKGHFFWRSTRGAPEAALDFDMLGSPVAVRPWSCPRVPVESSPRSLAALSNWPA